MKKKLQILAVLTFLLLLYGKQTVWAETRASEPQPETAALVGAAVTEVAIAATETQAPAELPPAAEIQAPAESQPLGESQAAPELQLPTAVEVQTNPVAELTPGSSLTESPATTTAQPSPTDPGVGASAIVTATLPIEPAAQAETPAPQRQTDSTLPTEESLLLTVRNLKATCLPNQNVALTWDLSPGAEAYYVYRRSQNNDALVFYKAVSASSKSFIDTQALPGFNFYRVFPVKTIANNTEMGRSENYKYVQVNPKPVLSLRAEAQGSSINLSWLPSLGSNKYLIYRKTVGQETMTEYTHTPDKFFADLEAEGGYNFYRVIPVYVDKNLREFVGTSNRYVYAPNAPKEVDSAQAKPEASGAVELSWQAVPGANEYRVFRSLEGETEAKYQDTVTSLSYSDNNTVAGANKYWVQAVFKTGTSHYERPLTIERAVVANTVPQAVRINSVTADGRWGLKVNWNEAPGAEKYLVYRRDPKGNRLIYHGESNSTDLQDSLLLPGLHFYRIYPVRIIAGTEYRGQSANYSYQRVAEVVNSENDRETFTSFEDFKHFHRVMLDKRAELLYSQYELPAAPGQGAQELLDQVFTSFGNWLSAIKRDAIACQMPVISELKALSKRASAEAIAGGLYRIKMQTAYQYHSTSLDYESTKAAVATIAATANQEEGDYNKLKRVFEYETNHTSYASAADGSILPTTTSGLSPYSAVAAHIDGQAVCQGYAGYLMLILEKMGYKSFYAASDLDRHAWVLVKIDDKWYHLDPTHADRGNWADLRYFLLSSNAMQNLPLHTMYAHFPSSLSSYNP